MTREPIGIGVAGVGAWGRTWLPIIRGVPQYRLCFAADPSPEATAELDEVPIFPSLEAALDTSRAEAVVIATPPAVRLDPIRTAVERGVAVLVEKPLAADAEAVRAIADLADGGSAPLMVSQNYRFSEHVQAMTDGVAAEGGFAAGNYLYAMDASFMRDVYRARMPDCLAIEMCVHHWDLMRAVVGKDPVRVFGRSWNPPGSWSAGDGSISAVFEWASGHAWSYSATWSAPMNRTGWFGEATLVTPRAEWRLGEAESERRAPGEPVRHWPAMGNEETRRRVLLAFAASVRGGGCPPCDLRDNLGTMAMVFGVIESARAHRSVDLVDVRRRLGAGASSGVT